MFIKDQTVVYRPNGQRAAIKATPDACQIHLGVPGKEAVPAYAVQFYIETPEGPTEDGMLLVAPRTVVEANFRLPNVSDQFEPSVFIGRGFLGPVLHYDRKEALAFHNTGMHTQLAIRALTKEPTRGTGAPIIQSDEVTFEATPIRQRTRSG